MTQEEGNGVKGKGNGDKSQDLAFEAFKHLTTLNAGSIVLISTFLKDIFPKDQQGHLSVDPMSTVLIVLSFLLFGMSLAGSTYTMYWIATPDFPSWWREQTEGILGVLFGREGAIEKLLMFLTPLAGTAFFFGLVCFGITVLTNLQ